MIEILRATNVAGDLVFWLAFQNNRLCLTASLVTCGGLCF
jgi:hypothetical protein